MASTYTTNNGIEKPGTGEQSGTWGTTTNLNFDIIDQALCGVVSISLSGTTHTLSTTDGSLSDGMNRVLVLGGSPSGTNTVTISPNNQEKIYFVANNSGQSAVFTQGSGANVTVLNGTQAIIYADGAGSGAAVAEIKPVASAGSIGTASIADDAVTADKIADNAVGADAINIAGDGTSGQVVQSDGDGSFSYLTLPATFLSGMVMPYAGASAPSGWLLSYGQAISRSTYSDLFSAIGTTYGVGDGSTTFNVPDFRGRTIAGQDDMGGVSANRLTNQSGGLNGDTLGAAGGSETHTLTEAELASHTHFLVKDGTYNGGSWGLSSTLPIREGVPNDTPDNHQYILKSGTGTADVGLSSATGSGTAHNNVQPTIILNYIIKT